MFDAVLFKYSQNSIVNAEVPNAKFEVAADAVILVLALASNEMDAVPYFLVAVDSFALPDAVQFDARLEESVMVVELLEPSPANRAVTDA